MRAMLKTACGCTKWVKINPEYVGEYYVLPLFKPLTISDESQHGVCVEYRKFRTNDITEYGERIYEEVLD